MIANSGAGPRYEWKMSKVREDRLEETLNAMDGRWEIFSVTPTIHFGAKVMGAPVPSEILYTIIARRPRPQGA
jgi:hypothetical protein